VTVAIIRHGTRLRMKYRRSFDEPRRERSCEVRERKATAGGTMWRIGPFTSPNTRFSVKHVTPSAG